VVDACEGGCRKGRNEIIRKNLCTCYGRYITSVDHDGLGVWGMKQIIDNETGEIITVQDENEKTEELLVKDGVLDKETYEIISNMLYYQDQFKIFKSKLEDAMRKNGIKKWYNDYFTATVREDSLQKRVDNDRLKEDGLYEKYLKLVPTKGGLTIKFKEKI